MHDIVAHSLTVMIAQADGGRYAADADPAAATRALGTIAETGRAALTDMRRLLGVLRTDPAPDGRADAGGSPRGPVGGLAGAAVAPGRLPAGVRAVSAIPSTARPAPGTDHATGNGAAGSSTGPADERYAPLPAEGDLDALVDQMRASGLHVSLVRMGTPRYLPPGAGLTVYRIAQESLTNVLKHAGPGPKVTVLVHWLPDAVAVEVNDDGRGASAGSDGLGQGLLGMRERAAMFGGTVTAGPRPGGGFRVRAQLPTPGGPGVGAAPLTSPVTGSGGSTDPDTPSGPVGTAPERREGRDRQDRPDERVGG
jgi:signal transduction histidine kinase